MYSRGVAEFKNPSIYNICNTLGCLDDGTNESSSKRLIFQIFFFSMISCKILCKNPFNLFFHFFYIITKIKIKSFECTKSIKSIKIDNTWNIRLLVNDSFVPSSKQPFVIYCRLGFQMGMGRQKQVRASGINAYPISGYMRQPSPSHQMCAPKNIKQLNHQQYGNTHQLWSFNLRKRFFCIRDSTLQI